MSSNNLYVKCVGETSWESNPAKPWFDQPFVNYPDAAKYSEVRFQETFMKMYSLSHPPFMEITVDNDRLVDDIKYFKRNLTPSAMTPAAPFLQRGVFLSGEDLVRSNIPGIFDKLYIENSTLENEEDLFFPFGGKKIVEDKMKGVCGLYIGNDSMVQSDGMDVSTEIKKQINKDGFANNGNFWDIRLPSVFISVSFDNKEWNRVKAVSKDNPTAYIENYYLIDPITGKRLIQFNPVVFSMLFKIPYIMDAFLREKQVEEPGKEVLLNTSILYYIIHGYVLNQMGNYSMDMHYNLLKKMQVEGVGYLRFRNQFIKRANSENDKNVTDFGVQLLDFKNRIFAYQQFFNLVLFYLMYATTVNEGLKQYARPFNTSLDIIFELINFFTSKIGVDENNMTETASAELTNFMNNLFTKYNEHRSDDVRMSGTLGFLVEIYTDLLEIESSEALKIYASYNIDDKRFVIDNQDINNFSALLGVFYTTESNDVNVQALYKEVYTKGKNNFIIQYHAISREIQKYIASANLASNPREYARKLKLLIMYEAKANTNLYYFPNYNPEGQFINFTIVSSVENINIPISDIQSVLRILYDYEQEIENAPVQDAHFRELIGQRNDLIRRIQEYQNQTSNDSTILTIIKKTIRDLKAKAVQPADYVINRSPQSLNIRQRNNEIMKSFANSLVDKLSFYSIQ